MAVINGVDEEAELVKGAKRSQLLAESAVRLLTGAATVTAEVVVHLHDDHAHLDNGHAFHPDLAECLAATER